MGVEKTKYSRWELRKVYKRWSVNWALKPAYDVEQ